jgi:hypothetical protein
VPDRTRRRPPTLAAEADTRAQLLHLARHPRSSGHTCGPCRDLAIELMAASAVDELAGPDTAPAARRRWWRLWRRS